MTEAEWLACTDPSSMLTFLRGRASDRKLRLWICACARRLWSRLADEPDRHAVEVAERYADGLASKRELEQVRRATVAARNLAAHANELLAWRSPACLSWCTTRNKTDAAALDASHAEAWYAAAHAVPQNNIGWKLDEDLPDTLHHERAWQVAILHDIFGNPFRTLSVSCLRLEWNDRTVPRLAQEIYEERAFDRLPILADALEEAGCTDADILNHCRQPGEHVRGCWVIDLIRGAS